jgi:hypothetical protein
MDYVTGMLILGGLALHFMGSWGEHWRSVGRVSPQAFIATDYPGWIAAFIAGALSYATLPQLGPMLGIEPPLGAVAAGYMASSLGAKIASFTPKK